MIKDNEIEKYFGDLKSRKSLEPDNVSIELYYGGKCVKFLDYHNEWRTAYVTFIFKEGNMNYPSCRCLSNW